MKITLLTGFMVAALVAAGQNPPPILSYGNAISLEDAKRVVAAAEALAVKNQWPVAIVVVDTGGNLVLLEKMDNTQLGSIDVAIGKARTANNFKRPTKAFEDAIAGSPSGARILSLPGAVTIQGGELILSNGKIIGAIGVSGVQSTQDAEVAKAGLAVIK